MKRIKNDLRILVRDEFGDELREVEEENLKLKQELAKVKQINQQKQEIKSIIEKLIKIEDLNTPQARKLLNTVLLFMRDYYHLQITC